MANYVLFLDATDGLVKPGMKVTDTLLLNLETGENVFDNGNVIIYAYPFWIAPYDGWINFSNGTYKHAMDIAEKAPVSFLKEVLKTGNPTKFWDGKKYLETNR